MIFEGHYSSVCVEKTKLSDELKRTVDSHGSENDCWHQEKCKLDEEIRSLRKTEEERLRLGGDVERLETELTKMTQIHENNTTLTLELDKVKKERETLCSDTKRLEEELTEKIKLEEDNVRLSSNLKSYTEEKNKLTIDLQRLETETADRVKILENDNVKVNDEVKALKEEKTRIEEAKAKLEDEVKKIRLLEGDKKDLEIKNNALAQNMEELKIRYVIFGSCPSLHLHQCMTLRMYLG